MAQKLSSVKKIIRQFVELLSEEGIHVQKAILYGSYAKGEARDESDIDLVIISKDLNQFSPLDRLTFLSRIAWKFDAPLEVLGYTPTETRDKEGKSILWDEIRKTGRVIYQAA